MTKQLPPPPNIPTQDSNILNVTNSTLENMKKIDIMDEEITIYIISEKSIVKNIIIKPPSEPPSKRILSPTEQEKTEYLTYNNPPDRSELNSPKNLQIGVDNSNENTEYPEYFISDTS